jgi:hypothetical protein
MTKRRKKAPAIIARPCPRTRENSQAALTQLSKQKFLKGQLSFCLVFLFLGGRRLTQ